MSDKAKTVDWEDHVLALRLEVAEAMRAACVKEAMDQDEGPLDSCEYDNGYQACRTDTVRALCALNPRAVVEKLR